MDGILHMNLVCEMPSIERKENFKVAIIVDTASGSVDKCGWCDKHVGFEAVDVVHKHYIDEPINHKDCTLSIACPKCSRQLILEGKLRNKFLNDKKHVKVMPMDPPGGITPALAARQSIEFAHAAS